MEREIAKLLLDLGCLQLSPREPFVYASGLKGPIYCDNRKILSHVSERSKVTNGFIGLLKESNLVYNHLAGIATGGIPLASFMAHQLKSSMIYVRSKPKGHGRGNQVEGDYKNGETVVLIEDLVNQGASLKEAIDGIEASGLKGLAVFCIVDYEMAAAKERVKNAGLPLYSLTTFTTICELALENKIITKDDGEMLRDWHRDPKNWKG